MLMTRARRRDARRMIERRIREHTQPEATRCRCEARNLPCFDECVRVAARNARPFPYDPTVHDTDTAIRRAIVRDQTEAVIAGIMHTDPRPCTDCTLAGTPRSLGECTDPDHCPF